VLVLVESDLLERDLPEPGDPGEDDRIGLELEVHRRGVHESGILAGGEIVADLIAAAAPLTFGLDEDVAANLVAPAQVRGGIERVSQFGIAGARVALVKLKGLRDPIDPAPEPSRRAAGQLRLFALESPDRVACGF
jgi:hypothetical protein